MLGWDTETCLIRPGLLAPPLVCVSYARFDFHGDIERGLIHWSEAEPFLERALQEPSTLANAPYDLAVAGVQFPKLMPLIFDALEAGLIHDVLLRQKLLDIAYGRYRGYWTKSGHFVQHFYSLDALSKRFLKLKLEKDGGWRLRYAELRDLPCEEWPEAAKEYAIKDAVCTLGVHVCQDQYTDPNGMLNEPVSAILANEMDQVRAAWGLHLMSVWGIRTDSEAVRELHRRVWGEYERVRDRLKACGLLRKTGARNTVAAKALMVEALGVEGCRLTDTGLKKLRTKEMTHEEAVAAGYIKLDEESCDESGLSELRDYARFGSLIKLESTYVRALYRGIKYPIQSRFEPLLETGRTSSSDPNIQNPPRSLFEQHDENGEPIEGTGDLGVRECFIPRPGHVFIACDYDKAELCSLAQVCLWLVGRSRLAERLNNRFDPHLDMGAQLMGIPYAEADRRKKMGDKEVKKFRQMAKAANFGLPGGLGAATFMKYAKAAYGVVLTLDEAKALKQRWLEAWPEMEEYFKQINNTMITLGEKDEDGRHIQRAWIKQFVSNRFRGCIPYTVCCNTYFQGLTADAGKDAVWQITKRQFLMPESALYGSHMVNWVHDEAIVEVREDRAHEAAMELRQVMIQSFKKYHPDMHRAVNASPALMRRWAKEAEPVWKDGRLIPWEDREAAA